MRIRTPLILRQAETAAEALSTVRKQDYETRFQLRFRIGRVEHWAGRYEYPEDEGPILGMVSSVKERGFLDRDEFLAVCRWKTRRSQSRCRSNSGDFIREVTRCALETKEEQLRIEVLTLLKGVGWPSASVILHFFHPEPHPILDFRALWSLKCDVPRQYRFEFWSDYVNFCRALSAQAGVTMRNLDRALWQYSKEKQRA